MGPHMTAELTVRIETLGTHLGTPGRNLRCLPKGGGLSKDPCWLPKAGCLAEGCRLPKAGTSCRRGGSCTAPACAQVSQFQWGWGFRV